MDACRAPVYHTAATPAHVWMASPAAACLAGGQWGPCTSLCPAVQLWKECKKLRNQLLELRGNIRFAALCTLC